MSDSLNISGPAFPLTFDGRGKLRPSSDDEHVRHSIQQILLTRRGSLPFKPTFGSRIPERVFDPSNSSALIRADAEEALLIWEKRIDLLSVESVPTTEFGFLRYKVVYRLKSSQQIQELIQEQRT